MMVAGDHWKDWKNAWCFTGDHIECECHACRLLANSHQPFRHEVDCSDVAVERYPWQEDASVAREEIARRYRERLRECRAWAVSVSAMFISSRVTAGWSRRISPFKLAPATGAIDKENRPSPRSVNSTMSPDFSPSERRTADGRVIRPWSLIVAKGIDGSCVVLDGTYTGRRRLPFPGGPYLIK